MQVREELLGTSAKHSGSRWAAKGFMSRNRTSEKPERNEATGQVPSMSERRGRWQTASHFITLSSARGPCCRVRSGQETWTVHGRPATASGPIQSLFRHSHPSHRISNNPLPTTFLWLYNTVFPRVLWHFIKAARRWDCPFSRSEINSSFIASGNARAAVRTCDRFSQLQDLWSILYLHLHRSPAESRCSSHLPFISCIFFPFNDQFVIFSLLFLLTSSFFLHLFLFIFPVWVREWCLFYTNLHCL